MSAAPHPVAIITGAERGIGAGLAVAFRRCGYAVVGTSRSIPAADEPDLLTVQGDIEATAARLRDERLIADLTVVEVADGPHNIGWTHPEEVNAALLDLLGGKAPN